MNMLGVNLSSMSGRNASYKLSNMQNHELSNMQNRVQTRVLLFEQHSYMSPNFSPYTL